MNGVRKKSPGRTKGAQRRYSRNEIERLRVIAGLDADGIGTAGIRRILDMQVQIDKLEGKLDRERDRRAKPG